MTSRDPSTTRNDARFAPRPHRVQQVPPPPKMDKALFDRCGNCTSGFGFLSRKRHCANCGFVYCSDCCTEKFKLVKFQGVDSRDARVCDYCKEFLKKVDRMPLQVLNTMSVRQLREYIEAYGLSKEMPFVEKSELISAILQADITEYNEKLFRQTTPGFRDWCKRTGRNGTMRPNPPPKAPSQPKPPNSATSSSSNLSNSAPTSSGPNNQSTNAGRAPASSPTSAGNGMNSSRYRNVDEPSIPKPPPPRPESDAELRPPINIERERRPYVHTPEIGPTRPRSASSAVDEIELDRTHLEPAEFERRRRQYSFSTPDSHSPPSRPFTAHSSSATYSTNTTTTSDLREIVTQGIDISKLSTSVLLTIMRKNNCPIPPGAVEKDELIERVEEMASFLIASTPTQEKLPKVRDEDEDDCRICYERVADYCLVPCGHTGFCFMCARKMEQCPFCKVPVQHAQKLWKV